MAGIQKDVFVDEYIEIWYGCSIKYSHLLCVVLKEREGTRSEEKDSILIMICRQLVETEIGIKQTQEADVVYEVRRIMIQIIRRIIFVPLSLKQQMPDVRSLILNLVSLLYDPVQRNLSCNIMKQCSEEYKHLYVSSSLLF